LSFRLKFYEKEREIFKEEFNTFLSDEEAVVIISKLARHFKLWRITNTIVPAYRIKFYGTKQRASVGYNDRVIRIPHNPSLGLIIHELAHIVHGKKYDKWSHDKKLLKIMEKMLNYIYTLR